MKQSKIEIERRDKQAAEFAKKYGKVLYHYTSIDSLYGMIQNGEFWWGNTATMNDKSELTDFVRRLREALRRDLQPQKAALEDLFDKINNRVKSEYPYAMSFSRHPDDAAQWERYAKNATGIRIAFNTEALVKVFCYHDVLFSEVFYRYDIKNHDHYNGLREYLLTGKTPGFNNIDGVIDNIIYCAAIHKHESFCSEAEVRLLTLPIIYEKHLVEHHSQVSFELLGNEIRKVLKVDFASLCAEAEATEEDLFSEIMIGPRSAQSDRNLKEFCEFYGYTKLATKTKTSKCPLR